MRLCLVLTSLRSMFPALVCEVVKVRFLSGLSDIVGLVADSLVVNQRP